MPTLMTPENILKKGNEKILIYGAFGTGKTHLALTSPGPIWVLGVGGDNEFKTRYSVPFRKKVGHRVIYFDHAIEERTDRGMINDNPTGYDAACDRLDEFLVWNREGGYGVATIIVDNATMLNHYAMNKAIAAEFFLGGAKGADKATLVKEKEWGIRKPHDSTWDGGKSLIIKFITYCFELPFNFVFIAHERIDYEGAGDNSRAKKAKDIMPDLIGQHRTQIPNMFDNVWRNTVGGGGRNRVFGTQTVGDEKVYAKTRLSGILDPNEERDLNITEVLQKFADYSDEITNEETGEQTNA